ncbi:SLATT domain-containing protein [Proteus mirabilis]|nr:SLATT domain-containing protein [Proteus mirabilis]
MSNKKKKPSPREDKNTNYLDISKLIEELKKDTKVVATARFNKVQRLKNQSNFSLLSISFLSFVLIIISIIEQKMDIKNITIPLIHYPLPFWYFSIISSIFILAISVYISKNQYEIQISRLYASAVKINTISRALEATLSYSLSNADLSNKHTELLKNYNEVLDEDHINHDTIDYMIVKNKWNTYAYWKIRIMHFITNTTTYYWLIILISIIILISLTLQVLSLC